MKIWHYVYGYVIIEIVGTEVGRFVNLCVKKGVVLHNAINDNSVFSAGVSARNLLEVRQISEKCKCELKIVQKIGLVDLRKIIKTRLFMFVGIALFALCLMLFSKFVWIIDIQSEHVINEEEIRVVLRRNGIYEMAMSSPDNITKAELSLLRSDERISWVDIRERGMKIAVKISKSPENPVVHDVDRPCNIIADKRGVIEDIVTTVGRKKVKEGDAFDKGDVLVSGVLPLEEMTPDEEAYTKRKSEDGECLLVHSQARIVARTWYDFIYPMSDFANVSFEKDGSRDASNTAYNLAKKELSKIAAKDCIIKKHSVKILDNMVKVEIECSESVGIEKYVSKEVIIRQKELQLLREKEMNLDKEKDKKD